MIRALIITEGGKDVGYGHLTRCKAISQSLEEIEIKTSIMVGNNKVIDLIKLRGEIEKYQIVIIDSYLIDEQMYRKITNFRDILFVHVDDNLRLPYQQGIVINGTIGAEKFFRPKRIDVEYLLGTQYIPLRKAFWDFPLKSISPIISRALVTFGGEDVRSLTSVIGEWLLNTFKAITLEVVIGERYTNSTDIKRLVDNPKVNTIINPSELEMRKLMMMADIAISAGGQTMYELARTGTPTISIQVADNQTNNVKGWTNEGFCEHAGNWSDKNLLFKLKKCWDNLSQYETRVQRSEIGKNLVDGQGARRIAEVIRKRMG